MAITHTSRNGKTYYLHTGPMRGGGTQHFFSTKTGGTLAQRLPEGFEVYEIVNGQGCFEPGIRIPIFIEG